MAISLICSSMPSFAAENSKLIYGKLGEVVPGIRSPEGNNILFSGQADHVGRPRVFSLKGNAHGETLFRRGVMEYNGAITWDDAINSRSAGQNNYPNYPEQKGRPLKSNRALVPAGPVVDHTRPVGHSGMNVPSTEYLPEFDSRNKPSRLHETLEWSRAKSDELKKMLRQVIKGERPLIEVPRAASLESSADKISELEKRGQNFAGSAAGTFTYSAVVFYTALGFTSAWTLMTDYANNPLAWESYLESLSDPVGWAALAGFMLGSSWFFNKMDGTKYQGKFLRQLPFFAGALLAGTLVSTPISVLGNDKDFQACAGFTAYKNTNHFAFDHAACDKLYARWTNESDRRAVLEEITLKFVPTAANLLVSGGLYFGALQSARFLFNKPAIAQSLRSIPISKAPSNGLWGIGLSALQITLFLGAYEVSSGVFGVEKSVKELWLTHQNLLFKNPNGTSLQEAETNLFEEWNKVRANGWKDPYAWKKTCFDDSRESEKFFNCEDPKRLDFMAILERYGKLQASWRALQMQDTMQAFRAWTKKVEDFQTMISTSFRFYKETLDQVGSPYGIDVDKLKLSGNGLPWGPWTKHYDKTWRHVYTPQLNDYLLTSMACGPELEGYGGSGVWEQTRQFMKTWVTGNTHPNQLIDDKTGFSIKFNPPRITTPIPGTRDTVCEHTLGLFKPIDWISPSTSSPKVIFLDTHNGQYKGLPSYIEKNVRASIFTPDGINRFEDWWSQNVARNAHAINEDMRTEYKKMLDTTFKKALTNKDYYWCDIGASVKSPGLEKHLRRLSLPDESCGPEALHRLSYGVLNGMRDEMKLYMALLLDLVLNNIQPMGVSLPGESATAPAVLGKKETLVAYENAIVPRARKVLEKFDQMVKQMAITDPNQRESVDQISDEAVEAFDELRSLVLASATLNQTQGREVEVDGEKVKVPAMPPYQVRWAEALLGKSLQLFKESVNYFTITTTFETTKNKE